MSFDSRRLLELLPSVYGLRDVEVAGGIGGLLTPAEALELDGLETTGPADATERRRLQELRDKRQRGPLAALLAVLSDQIAVLEENLAQLYDDQFIETAAPWAVPYIGDLIGYRTLHGNASSNLRRSEVAHTIGFRRRKGTASMLEQLARDVTGWNARAVEYFALLATTQSMNHRRLGNQVAPSMRDGDALEWVGGPFDAIPRTLEVRRIETGAGRYNIPNVGIFLWRIDAQRLRRSPATPHPGDLTGRRFRFSPLGFDTALHTRPEREDAISHLAEPINVPVPISRRRLDRDLRSDRPRLYGEGRSLEIEMDDVLQPAAGINGCDLSDDPNDPGGWAHDAPPGSIAVDPVLGRLVVAADLPLASPPRVTFHFGWPAEIGGGEYARAASFALTGQSIRVPTDEATIADALAALGGSGIVEIVDSGRYMEDGLDIDVSANGAIELRAAEGRRPTLELTKPVTVHGGAGTRAFINGLLVVGDAIRVPTAGGLSQLTIGHCTLVPGRALAPDGSPAAPGAPSLTVATNALEIIVERSIVGSLHVVDGSQTSVIDSIVDAGSATNHAYARPGAAPAAGGELMLESSTVVGRIRCDKLTASNVIILGRTDVRRRQEGCLRFSYAPLASTVPQRHRCQPTPGAGAVNVPHFASLQYGVPQYCRLAAGTPEAILSGAEDESEMGAFRSRYEPQRHADLLTRLDEYLRVSLEAGIFHAS